MAKNFDPVDTSGVDDLLAGLSSRFDDNAADQGKPDGTTARRRNGMTASDAKGGPKEEQPPAAASRSKYTLLLDSADAVAFDEIALGLRRYLGRPVDKSAIVRALIQLAHSREDLAHALAEQIRPRPTPAA
ncbi:hypothetical protein [Streptomyces flavofungini]|uniref:hypothetical protein n=1 Tax=Streptomyces flavofungini TaxID=68200 RepID=UPI0025AF648D|nr:hypothetical protein [Streptomyces flavofungini]WJV51823.1 hypothetical protein QUY26_40660 [Streptomyces flavofungini]WJV51828.1 hypothetical protein QUY26_40685 [Streptomyces flavofungini]